MLEWDGSSGKILYRAGDANLYRYVGNNPVGATNPSGNFKVELRYRGSSVSTPGIGSLADRISPAKRADIVMTDRTGRRAVWAGNSEGFLKPNSNDNYRLSSAFYVSDPKAIQLVYDDRTNCPNSKLELKIRSFFDWLASVDISYAPLGRNSNSGAFQALREAGLGKNFRPKNGINAPRWEINPRTDKRDSQVPLDPAPKRSPMPSFPEPEPVRPARGLTP